MNITLSPTIQKQAKIYKVDLHRLINEAVSDISELSNKKINMDIDVKFSLFPPATWYYTFRKPNK